MARRTGRRRIHSAGRCDHGRSWQRSLPGRRGEHGGQALRLRGSWHAGTRGIQPPMMVMGKTGQRQGGCGFGELPASHGIGLGRPSHDFLPLPIPADQPFLTIAFKRHQQGDGFDEGFVFVALRFFPGADALEKIC